MDVTKIDWLMCQRIADTSGVSQALFGFSEDSTGDNAVGLVREVIGAYIDRQHEVMTMLTDTLPEPDAAFAALHKDTIEAVLKERDKMRWVVRYKDANGFGTSPNKAFERMIEQRAFMLAMDSVDDGELINLAQKRTERPEIRDGREAIVLAIADARRFRLMCDLFINIMVAPGKGDMIVNAMNDIDEFENGRPTLAYLRTCMDELAKRGLLKEVTA